MPTFDVRRKGSVSAVSWIEKNGLFTEPRLSGLGLGHGVTHRSLGGMKEKANRKAALKACGLSGDVLTLTQVHGAKVHRAIAALEDDEGDGWVTDTPGRCIGVFVADCLPIFMWTEDRKAVGVFHCGWRGTAAGMPSEAVSAFEKIDRSPSELFAAIGPHIGSCCYEVGEELRDSFSSESFVSGETLRLDLGSEAARGLMGAGISADKISVSSDCTACCSDRFFSFRKEKRNSNMLAFIAVPE